MPKDRIRDLQKATPWPRVTYRRISRQYRNHDSLNATDSIVPFIAIEVDNDHSVAELLAQIDLVRILVDKIEELTKDVEKIHKKMLDPMAESKLAQEVDDKTADIKKLAYDVATKLKKMERIQEDQTAIDKASAQWRIKESQIFNLTRRFREIMNQYNLESVTHRERCKKSIMREFEISGSRKTDNEIEEMLETGFPGTSGFSLLVDIQKAKQAVSEIEARHRDITKLETSIKELHDMFLDLARLVVTQGEMIDVIEYNVLKAQEYVDDATTNVKKTLGTQKDTRKKKLCICFILVTIVIILILLVSVYIIIKRKFISR